MSADSNKKPFIQTPGFGALITGVFGLLAVVLGYWLANLSVSPKSYDREVFADTLPWHSTEVHINEGDEFEIWVLEANEDTWVCHENDASPLGEIGHDSHSAVYSAGRYCALVGRVGDGPPFTVGAYYKSVSNVSGELHLNANDDPPDNCRATPNTSCYADNSGSFYVRISVSRE